MTVAKTPFKLKVAMPDILENAEANLTPRMRNLVNLLWSERKDLEQSVVGMNQEIEQIASSDPTCQQLRQIPVTARWWHRDRGSDRQRRSLPTRAASSSPGWGLCRGSTRLAGKRGYLASASAGTYICASSSCMPPDPLFSRLSESDPRSVHGSIRWGPERRSTSWSQRQPTSWLASPGPFYQAAKPIAQR